LLTYHEVLGLYSVVNIGFKLLMPSVIRTHNYNVFHKTMRTQTNRHSYGTLSTPENVCRKNHKISPHFNCVTSIVV